MKEFIFVCVSYKAVLFESGEFYHIYHQGNAGESIFRCDENFRYFLEKYSIYIQSICETYAFVLMPNHFHFAVRFRDREIITKILRDRFKELHPEKIPPEFLTPVELAQAISKQFSDFLNGYTQGFNKVAQKERQAVWRIVTEKKN